MQLAEKLEGSRDGWTGLVAGHACRVRQRTRMFNAEIVYLMVISRIRYSPVISRIPG